MNKRTMLNELENAKNVHLDQMDKIELLLKGFFITEPTELGKMECEFGRIFYGNKEFLLPIIGAQFFNKIDILHEEWHNEYASVYNIFYKEKKGLFSKIRGTQKIKPVEYEKANMYFQKLTLTTNQLIRMINTSMRRVDALNDSKFKN